MKYKKRDEFLVLSIDEKHQNISILDLFQQFHLSKKTIHLLRQNKAYYLNEQFVPVTTILHLNDQLSIKAYDLGIDYLPQYYNLQIIYEDDILCIVNKPAATIIHPENKQGKNTLCNYVAYYYKHTQQNYPVRFLHRLDKDTTGLVMFCKCSLLQPCFDMMISEKRIKKTYLAWIKGHMNQKSLTINQPIGNDRHHQQKMIISRSGKYAMTHIQQLKVKKDYSLVECQIETGRKHQIRVHLNSINHPIIGDELYGNKSSYINRMALHAYRLQFIHPLTNKKMDIICDIPDDMKKMF